MGKFKIPADLKGKRKGKDGTEQEFVVVDRLAKTKEGTDHGHHR